MQADLIAMHFSVMLWHAHADTAYPRSLHQSPGCLGVLKPSLIMCSWESRLMRTSLLLDSWKAALWHSVLSTGACSHCNPSMLLVEFIIQYIFM